MELARVRHVSPLPRGRLAGAKPTVGPRHCLVASIGKLTRTLIALDGADDSFGHPVASATFDGRCHDMDQSVPSSTFLGFTCLIFLPRGGITA
jgi:hypothetical protein